MYHEERKITVFSNASFLEQIIQQSIKEGPISYHICTSPCMDNGWHDSDIVVCDLPVRKLEHYRKQMKKTPICSMFAIRWTRYVWIGTQLLTNC